MKRLQIIQSRYSSHGKRILAGGLAVLVLLAVLPHRSNGASNTLTLSPSSGSFTAGSTFSVRLLVNAGQAINAAEAVLSFPTDKLEVKSVSTASSRFTLWALGPTYSNGSGTITFAGGLPSPGFTGNGGLILTIVFQAKATGSAKVTIGSAQITANDGQGTNVLTGVGSGTYIINQQSTQPSTPQEPARPAPTVHSSTHGDESKWYSSRDVSATWTAGSGVRGYSAVFDQSPSTIPPERSEGMGAAFSRTGLADGVWYLHVRAQYPNGWSGTRHVAFHIDGTAPEEFAITIDHASPTDRTATISFEATDATSGIDHYEIRNPSGTYTTVMSPLSLADLLPGKHDIVIRAIDKAGNIREASNSFETIGPPAPTVFFDADILKFWGEQTGKLTLLAGQPIVLRGFAKKTDTLHIIVRSTESVFEFPVAEIIDPNPIEQAPEGFEAWIVEISPDLSPGDHTIRVYITNDQGLQSTEAPVIEFRVVTNVILWNGILIPYMLLIKVLISLIVILLLGVLLLMFFVLKYRHRLALQRGDGGRKKKTSKRSAR